MLKKELTSEQLLAKKEQSLKDVSHKILCLNDSIQSTASMLKFKRQDDKSKRVSTGRIKSHISGKRREEGGGRRKE